MDSENVSTDITIGKIKDPFLKDPSTSGFILCPSALQTTWGYEPNVGSFYITVAIIPKKDNPLYSEIANSPLLLHDKPLLWKHAEHDESKYALIKGMKDFRQTNNEIAMTLTFELFDDSFKFVEAVDKYEQSKFLLDL